MRIALVTPDYLPEPIGGAGISCALLARQLRARGHTVDVYALTGRRQAGRSASSSGGADIRLPRPATLYGRNRLASRAVLGGAEPYDVVHVYESSLLPAARVIQDRSNMPVIAQLNNLRAACFTPEYALKYGCQCGSLMGALWGVLRNPEPASRLRGVFYVLPAFRLAQRVARGVRRFIALSEDTKERYVSAGFDASRIAVVPNMYDDEVFPPREPVSQETDEVGILCVGQLDHRKGVLDLARAFAALPTELEAVGFLSFVGRGKEEAALRGLANRLGIASRVQIRHTDYRSLRPAYQQAHLAVQPARWPEPFGRTKLEAMAFGLPMLTSDHGSAREVLGDAAWYYAPFDVAELAAGLGQLLQDPRLRRRLGEAGRARLERYAPAKIVPQVLRAYEEAQRATGDGRSGDSPGSGGREPRLRGAHNA